MAKAKAKKQYSTQPTNTTPEVSPEEKLLKELRGEFLADFNADKAWVKKKSESEDFYDGEQWTEEELRTLKDRGQAPVVINRTKSKIDAISGMQMEMGVDTKAYPKGIRDFEMGRHMSTAIRHVEQTNDFDSEENEAFEELLKGGRGWYKTFVEWDDFNPVIRTQQIDNSDVVPDRFSKRQDLSDAKRVHETIWMDVSDAKKLFPGKDKEIDGAVTVGKSFSKFLDDQGRRKPDQYRNSPNTEEASDEEFGEFVDKARKQIRVVTTQYRESYLQKVLVAPGLGIVDVTEDNAEEVEEFKALHKDSNVEEFCQLRYRLHQCTFMWSTILEEKKDIADWDNDAQFWYTKVQGYRTKKKGIDYGLIEQMKHPQREHNKRRSKSVHLMNVNQVIREENAVDDPEVMREEINKPDGDVVVNTGHRFEVQRNLDIGMAQFQLLQESKQELDQTGVPRELEGISNARSGRDFQLRQRSQVAAIRKLFKNLRKGRQQVGKLWIKMIQHYWTSEMTLKVSDDPGAQLITLNAKVPAVDPQTGQPVVDPETGGPVMVIANNVAAGKYDLVVDESPEYVNLESETFAQYISLIERGFPIPPQMVASVAPVNNRQEWMDFIKAQQQAAQQAAAAQQAGAQGQMPQGQVAAG